MTQTLRSIKFHDLLAPRGEHGGKAPLATVSPVAQQALLDTHPLPLPLHQPLALPQPLQALLVVEELAVQLAPVPQQELLLGPALALPGPQPALLRLLLALLLVARALPAPLLLLELLLELVDVGQLLTLPVLVLKRATSEGGTRSQALLLQSQPVDLDVTVLDGQGGLKAI